MTKSKNKSLILIIEILCYKLGKGYLTVDIQKHTRLLIKVFEQRKYEVCALNKRISQDLFTLTFSKFKTTNVIVVKSR